MKVTVSSRDPDRILCAARLGQVFGSEGSLTTWLAVTLPEDVVDVRAVRGDQRDHYVSKIVVGVINPERKRALAIQWGGEVDRLKKQRPHPISTCR